MIFVNMLFLLVLESVISWNLCKRDSSHHQFIIHSPCTECEKELHFLLTENVFYLVDQIFENEFRKHQPCRSNHG